MLKEILTDGIRRLSSFYFGASCQPFSLNAFYVFEQTVTQIDPHIIRTYLEFTVKEVSPFNFDSDRIYNLGSHMFLTLAKRIVVVY